MKQLYPLVIDSWSHIITDKYMEARRKLSPRAGGDSGSGYLNARHRWERDEVVIHAD